MSHREPGCAATLMRRAVGVLTTACAGVLACPARADAHAFTERYNLPLPLWYYLAGAGLTVALSFVIAGHFVRANPRAPGAESPIPTSLALPPFLRASIRALSVAAFGVVLIAGYVGPQGEPTDNILPVTVWVLWWVGVTYVCALVGNAWALINPVAILADGLHTLSGHRAFRARVTLPPRIGVWPAVCLLLVFAWAEIGWPSNAVPPRLATAILLYSAGTWTGMAIFGRDAWLDRGDPFAAYFSLVSRFAPIDTTRGRLRAYGHGLIADRPTSISEVTFVIVALASVSFDGLRETPAWNFVASAAADAFYRTGLLAWMGNVTAGAVIKMIGLAATTFVLFAAFLAACRAGARFAQLNRSDARAFAGLFASSLVPIAIAYHLAHYLSYLLIQGQAIIPLISDPFGAGWDLFGTSHMHPNLAVVSARAVWTMAVAAIVAGHVAAVVIAHVTAIRTVPNRRHAIRSQYPMIVLMVAYTMFSLWVLSQPIVETS